MVTVNTLEGLYRVRNSPFGVAVSPATFQRLMDTTRSGIPDTCTLLDDIVFSGTSRKDHTIRLDMVLNYLKSTILN